jgi:hypothetical protein
MASRVGRDNRRSGEVERLRRLLVRLSYEDRPAFDALTRLILQRSLRLRNSAKVSRVYKKVYAK